MIESTRPPQSITLGDLSIELYARSIPSGRPILERSADPKLLQLIKHEGMVPIGDVASPFTDSRAGTQMNAISLETLRSQKAQLLDSIAWLREATRAPHESPSEAITDQQVWNLALIGVALPDYLMLRAKKPIHRDELPDVVGHIFIVSSGFRDIAQLGKSQKDAHTYTSGSEVYEIADRNELFNHSPASPFAGKTCPADKELITNVSTVLLLGIGGDAQNSVLPRYLAPDEIVNLTAFSEYNSQRIQNLQDLEARKITKSQYFERSAPLQENINIVLGRDPHRYGTASPRVNTVWVGGPVDTAEREIRTKLKDIYRQQQQVLGVPQIRIQPRKRKRR